MFCEERLEVHQDDATKKTAHESLFAAYVLEVAKVTFLVQRVVVSSE